MSLRNVFQLLMLDIIIRIILQQRSEKTTSGCNNLLCKFAIIHPVFLLSIVYTTATYASQHTFIVLILIFQLILLEFPPKLILQNGQHMPYL